jgi:hypothetical protein
MDDGGMDVDDGTVMARSRRRSLQVGQVDRGRRDALRVEAGDEGCGVHPFTGRCEAERPGEHAHHVADRPALGAEIGDVTAPCRFARRCPSAPSTSGTWRYSGVGWPSSVWSRTCRGVELSRSSPRTTCEMPCTPSSTTTARLYAGTPSARVRTTSSTAPSVAARDHVVDGDHLTVGAQPQRRRAAGGFTFGAFVRRELTAGAGVRAVGEVDVGRLSRRLDLGGSRAACSSRGTPDPARRACRWRRGTGRTARSAAPPRRPSRGRSQRGRRAGVPRAPETT